ncbi:MAG: hypothetical protein GY842_06015 [bacterium]|nr:hypothetical protein [bacterium]
MNELESSLHLFQTPMYRAGDGSWHSDYRGAVNCSGERLTWDSAGILATLAYSYPCGDRTLLKEVRRRPWLSKIGADGEPRLEVIPLHDTLSRTHEEAAGELIRLLRAEALQVCRGRKEIYVLVSGGLDSRILAGVISQLALEGRLEAKPVAVSWGIADSRDVVYGRAVADTLGLEWVHVPLGPRDILRNMEEAVKALGCLVSPLNLHAMPWFEQVSKDALVLAGSYGDSVGRAEFSGRHVLELAHRRVFNPFGIFRNEFVSLAGRQLESDLEAFRSRTPGKPHYVVCEHEMQCHYMRGMIAQAMSVINEYCTVYQAFTHPDVYSYMWSIHPALRTDDIYAAVLARLSPQLARLPWARTNRALRGKTEGARSDLRPQFHDYAEWVTGELYSKLSPYVDPLWFGELGVFDCAGVRKLGDMIRQGRGALLVRKIDAYHAWVWLACFRRYADWLGGLGKRVEVEACIRVGMADAPVRMPLAPRNKLHLSLARWRRLRSLVKRARRGFLMRRALRTYPLRSPD